MSAMMSSHSVSDEKSVSDNDRKQYVANEELQRSIAKRESKAVVRLRILVGLALIMAAVGVSVGVYFYTSIAEQDEFEQRFYASAEKIFESVGFALDRSLGVMDFFVVNLVVTAKHNNQTWPFVTMPDFCVRIAKSLSMSKAVFTSVYPMVLDSEKDAWEKYSAANDGWLDECLVAQAKGLNDTFFGTVSKRRELPSYINNGYDIPALEQPVYFPNWQSYPVTFEVFAPYNFDIWGIPFPSAQKTVETHQASISQSYLLPNPLDPAVSVYDEITASWLSNFLPQDRNSYEPVFDIYYVSRSLDFVKMVNLCQS
jgi:hypothetical protein